MVAMYSSKTKKQSNKNNQDTKITLSTNFRKNKNQADDLLLNYWSFKRGMQEKQHEIWLSIARNLG